MQLQSVNETTRLNKLFTTCVQTFGSHAAQLGMLEEQNNDEEIRFCLMKKHTCDVTERGGQPGAEPQTGWT